MTDEQITRAIAEKVMGLDCMIGDHYMFGHSIFDPLQDDSDCMAAWDRFSEGRLTELVFIAHPKEWFASYIPPDQDAPPIEATNQARRRAMCECMCKAVT